MNRRRLWITVVFLAIGMTSVVCRALQVMVIEHKLWQERAQRQQMRIISAPSPRGEIVSADGYVLATSVSRVAIQVDTHALDYPELFASAAAPLVGSTAAQLMQSLDSGRRAIWLAQMADEEVGRKVQSLAPAAVILVPDSERVYPLGTVAAAVVGFTGREELRTLGRAGLEHHFDALLAGEPGRYRAIRDAVQRQIRLQRLQTGRAGYDLELTLQARLQARCEAELASAVERFRARGGSVVVLEAHTGRILVLASVPSFDPAAPGEVPQENWRLRPVQDAFEPGSTIKPLVAAAALACPSFANWQRFDCRGRGIKVAGRLIRDHAVPGIYTLEEVVAQSSNTGIILVAQSIDRQLLHDTLDAFGFGQRTGVGFPAEARGILPAVTDWSAMSPAGVALGQELTTSPLQLALAYAVIANGGWLPRPLLVQRAGADRSGKSHGPDWRHRVLDQALAERLQRMLERVVLEGTGTLAQVPGLRVAGKTGTAQAMSDGTFDDRHHVPWFAGMFPLPSPRFVAVVTLDNPTEDYWASSVAAPLFARIAEMTAQLTDIPYRSAEQAPAGRGSA